MTTTVITKPWRPFELVTFDPAKIEESPWNRGDDWQGKFVLVADVGAAAEDTRTIGMGIGVCGGDVRPKPATDWYPPDWDGVDRTALVERVVALTPGGTASRLLDPDDGRLWTPDDVAGIALLKDGRFVAWESPLDPSGSGFHADTIGGLADILVATTARTAWLSISERSRSELRFATRPREEGIVMVLHDRYLELRLPLPPKHARLASGTETFLYALASESGEFDDLVEARVNELIMRWDRYYDDLERNGNGG